MDTVFAIALFIAVFGPVAWMVRAELQRLSQVPSRVRVATPRPLTVDRAQVGDAARA